MKDIEQGLSVAEVVVLAMVSGIMGQLEGLYALAGDSITNEQEKAINSFHVSMKELSNAFGLEYIPEDVVEDAERQSSKELEKLVVDEIPAPG